MTGKLNVVHPQAIIPEESPSNHEPVLHPADLITPSGSAAQPVPAAPINISRFRIKFDDDIMPMWSRYCSALTLLGLCSIGATGIGVFSSNYNEAELAYELGKFYNFVNATMVGCESNNGTFSANVTNCNYTSVSFCCGLLNEILNECIQQYNENVALVEQTCSEYNYLLDNYNPLAHSMFLNGVVVSSIITGAIIGVYLLGLAVCCIGEKCLQPPAAERQPLLAP